MPDYNGCEVCEIVKTFNSKVICVAYTADALRINVDDTERLGFEKILIKPILPVELIKEVDKLIVGRTAYK